MTTSAAAYFDASWVDNRPVSSRAKSRALRSVLNTSILGLGTVAALGTAAIAVTLAAGWMASGAVQPRVQLPTGPASLALVPYDPASKAAGRTSSWETAYIDRTKPLITEPGRAATAAAKPAPAAAKTGAIPLPRPLPAQLARGRADLSQTTTVAKAEPQAVTPPAQSLLPRPIAEQVPRTLALAIPAPAPAAAPAPLARPEPAAKPEVTAKPEVAAKSEFTAKPEGSTKSEKMAKADMASVEPKSNPVPKLTAPTSIPSVQPDSVSRTAVYDITGGIVHMPDGSKLEAHSGLGEKMDDPRYIKVRMRGPTPPNVYVLTEREKLFHGVRAIRLNPVHGERMFGRDGMLAHTYMLGPNGQSNGCVSFKDYRKFLTAFLDGKVDKMVVVGDLSGQSWKTAALQADGVSASSRRFAGGYSRPRVFPGESDSEPRYTSALGYGPERGAGNW
jgi:hypothetical protein